MANRIKGNSVEISGDTTVVNVINNTALSFRGAKR